MNALRSRSSSVYMLTVCEGGCWVVSSSCVYMFKVLYVCVCVCMYVCMFIVRCMQGGLVLPVCMRVHMYACIYVCK